MEGLLAPAKGPDHCLPCGEGHWKNPVCS